MNDEQFTRQEGIIARERVEGASIAIVGVGGLGSFAALALAKLGVGEIRAYDGDKVEAHNVSNQLYSRYQIGHFKVHALRTLVGELMPEAKIDPWPSMVNRDTVFTHKVIVSCVDSMRVRKLIWVRVKASPEVEYLIDMRAGAEALRVVTVPVRPRIKEREEDYNKTLYTDEEALAAPCTARSIIYTAFFAAGIVGVEVKRWLIGERREYAGITDRSFHCPSLQVL